MEEQKNWRYHHQRQSHLRRTSISDNPSHFHHTVDDYGLILQQDKFRILVWPFSCLDMSPVVHMSHVMDGDSATKINRRLQSI